MTKKSDSKSTEPILVGVDDGFAATDVVVMEGGKITLEISIPSRARQGEDGHEAFGESTGPHPCYETDGLVYTVSDSYNAESAGFNEYPFSGMNRVVIHHALRVAGLAGRDVRIATGLPLSNYYLGATANKNDDVLMRKDASVRSTVKSMDNSPLANILSHEVCPEGLSSWIDYAVDEHGLFRVSLDETVGVIDIGGRTTDVAVMLPGGKPDHARKGSAMIGVLNVVSDLETALLPQGKFPSMVIEKALRTRTIKRHGSELDISEAIDKAVRDVGEKIKRSVDRILNDTVDIDRILLVGGGAYFFKEALSGYPQLLVPSTPEFANARGFAKRLTMTAKKA